MPRNVRVVTGPAYAAQDRAQAMADALTARALRSRNPEQGGRVAVAMSPWEGVTQLGEALNARFASNYAERLAQADRERTQTANEQMIRDLAGERAPERLTEQGQPIPGSANRPPLDLETGRPMLVSDRAEQLAAAIGGLDPKQANQALSGAMLQRALATPSVERVDVGDAIAILQDGREVGRIPKGATPDAQIRERGENARWQAPSGNALLSADTTRRGQDVSAATAQRGQAVTMRGQDLSYDAALRGQHAAGGRAQGEAEAAAAKESRAIEQVWDMYTTARSGVMEGLARTMTGPIAGRIPAVTANQQIAEGGVAAMAPVLKQLFRVSGEGVFTDRDQALLLDMVPKRSDRPEAREAKMRNIDAIVRAKLGLPPETAPGPQATGGATGEWGAGDDALIGKYLGGT